MSLPNEPGIYLVKCAATGKVYVGSSVNVYRRWHARHVPQLRKGKHCNSHLQAAWRKYGEATFSCVFLERCELDALIVREQFWINYYDSARTGFNLNPTAGSWLGRKHTQTARQKISAAKGKTYIVRSPENKERQITNLYQFCRRHGLTHNAMSRVANGLARHHKGWECRYTDVSRAIWLTALTAGPRRAVKIKRQQVRCSKCRLYKNSADFTRDAQQRDGFAAYCRDCQAEKARLSYIANRAVRLQKAADYRARNRERIRIHARECYQQKRMG